MMRLLIILCFFPLLTFAQPYGNEWLNFDQDYYKIMVPENAAYKITYADLQAVGFPVDAVNPKNLQMFRRGEEIAIYVEGEDDDTLGPTDYILFYGQRNDGQLDQELYVAPEAQPHQYLALYADSAAYFLTYGEDIDGKRMTNLPAYAGPFPDNWVERELVNVLQTNYAPGIIEGENTRLTQFDYGEGFTGPFATEVSSPSRDIDISDIDFPHLPGPIPRLELVVVGRNDQIHNFEVLAGPDAGNLVSLGSFTITGYNHLKIESALDWNRIGIGGDLKVRISIVDDGGNRSRISISSVKINYARETNVNNLDQLEIMSEAKAGDNTLSFSNVPEGAITYDITDPFNPQRLTDTDLDPAIFTVGFTDASVARRILFSVPRNDFSIKKTVLREINPADHNYLIISHKAIMQPAGNYMDTDVVQAYAAYRSSTVGGGFDTLVVDVEMIFNQFSYGQPTPLAIYRFMKYMIALGDPEYLFIIGKGLNVLEQYFKKTNWTSSLSDYIPPAGFPGSDLAYTVGLGENPNSPAIPVGRLSVMKPIEVANYLDKVKEMEEMPYDALWRKNLLHLSGGDNLSQIDLYRRYVDDYALIAQGPFFGGQIATLSKKTTNSVEEINVAAQVNAGVNMITFFGHSSPNTSDIDIGFVSDPTNGYDNPGKYPLILMNGCETGNIYERAYIFGEDWIKTANKGATGVIAHSSYGYPFMLRVWSQFFYELAYADSTFIERSVGDIMVETSRRLLEITGPEPNIIFKTQAQQMGLQGDPAVKVFGTYTPDYEITSDNVELMSFNGGDVTAEEDSFAIMLGVRNFGAFVQDSLEVAIKRTSPNFTVFTDTLTFAPARYYDTLEIHISNANIDAAGSNIFEIELDPLNKISELNEGNNNVTYDVRIKTSGTSHILPFNYYLQPQDTVNLFFQPGDPLMSRREYLWELDSAADFSSIYLKSPGPIEGEKLLTVSQLPLLDIDTATYYWRTKYANPAENESNEWQQSSFSVIKGSTPGWAQLKYGQYRENSFVGLEENDDNKKLDFKNSEIDVKMSIPGHYSDIIDTINLSSELFYRDAQLNINGVNYLYFVNRFQPFTYCYYDRLNIVAIDKETSLPYAPIFGNQVDPWTCGRSPHIINSYPNGNKVSLDSILNAIGSGDKVLIFTVGRFNFNSLSGATISKLEDFGADASVLLSKDPGDPYLLVGTKGAGVGNSIAEIVADPGAGIPADEQTISYTGELTGTFSHGKISTTQIGPADDWQSLYLNVRTTNPDDFFALDVTGYNLQGEATLLFDNITDPLTDLSAVDASQFPFFKLDLDIADTVALTAPQLQQWIVNFNPVVEGLLVFDSLNEQTTPRIVLNEGEDSVRLRLRFLNISKKPYKSDSLEVIYSSFNRLTRNTVLKDTTSIIAPLPGESSPIIIDFDPMGMIGENDFNINVNPMKEIEQSFANNRINMPSYLEVIRDDSNPVLDVSFDGEYIFDGDIVSPNPNISIIVRDENPYLLKVDTAGITILLKRPCENCSLERIPLSGNDIVWTPEDESNPFAIDFTPRNLENGIYELQVQVEDATGNLSGTEPYKISFEVINESTVTNFYPYPNPFSTSVKFIFTLTGSELPDELMIRIMTISGRVVREIMQEELGPLKIGNNVTDYAWDGRDEFGDQLANGVYLFKVFMRKNGQNVELRPSAGDRGFTKGYGKLYLLR